MPDILSGPQMEEEELNELLKEVTHLKEKAKEFLSDLDFAHAMCMGDGDEFAVCRIVAQEVLNMAINLQREINSRLRYQLGLDAFGAEE